jgi:hypothetical protein
MEKNVSTSKRVHISRTATGNQVKYIMQMQDI